MKRKGILILVALAAALAVSMQMFALHPKIGSTFRSGEGPAWSVVNGFYEIPSEEESA